jgi:Secretion system C-terminal sorting domain
MNLYKVIKQSKIILLAWILLFAVLAQVDLMAQHNGGGHYDPDSLAEVTISGTAIVDSTTIHAMYYLDENNDGVADYQLNFGPYWYEPSEGNGRRPIYGEVITVSGGLHETFSNLNVVVVYEINSEFWRDAYEPLWDNMGHHSHSGGHHQGECRGYAFGFDHDTIMTVALNGTVVLDTTFIMGSYYLDQNNDTLPDYFLNFGPPWYEPDNGTKRPENGDQISIVGGMIDNDSIPMVIVYSVNGNEWRDSISVGNHLGSGWAHRDMTDSLFIHSTFDHNDWMQVQPGWHSGGGMHGGGMMSDSLFIQMMEVYHNNIPFSDNENVFAGYEIGVFQPNGSNHMWNSGGCGGMMNFNSNINFNLHFTDQQIDGFNISGDNIRAKYWDSQSGDWKEVSNVSVNLNTGTVNFNLATVSNYVILTSSSITSIEDGTENTLENNYKLKQNYPNPFNPSTSIAYQLSNSGFVSLRIFDLLGKEVAIIVNEQQSAGNYSVNFDGSSLTSGMYFYELKSGNFVQIRKMMLLK